jgi:ATP-binding cassette, subfamily B, bacterial
MMSSDRRPPHRRSDRFSPVRASSSSESDRLRRALKFAAPVRRAIATICALALVLSAVNAVDPLILKYIFDALAPDSGADGKRALLQGIALLLALGILREVINAFSNSLMWRVRLRIHFRLLEATVGRLHRMPLRLQRSEGVGAILTRLDRNIQGFIGALTQLSFNVLPSLLFLVVSVAVMVHLDWRLAVIVLAFAPLPVLIAAKAAPEQVQRERALLDQWSKIYSRFNEVLSGITTVRSFAMEDMEKRRFLRDVNAANREVIRGVGIDAGRGAASNVTTTIARVTVILLGGLFVLRGQATLGTLVAILGYVGGLFGPVQNLTGVYQTIRKASVALEDIFGILDVQEHLGDAPDAYELRCQDLRGEVVFESVDFRYEQIGRPLLSNVNLTVRAGETLAIVGPSGSGKTTMMALLMRFYDPLAGAIRIDGHDLRKVKQASLRRCIGVVLQDPLLFNDTVEGNIAYGRPEATRAEVEAAARAANAHEFIERLPDGYGTIVGERGARLSVGERQRLTIARALVKNPRLIILDEATASLDAETEGLVQDALERLMANRTTFVIAHRLSTIVHADQIIVLKDGQIAERGRHAELMRVDGYYAALVKRQTRGLIQNEGEPL